MISRHASPEPRRSSAHQLAAHLLAWALVLTPLAVLGQSDDGSFRGYQPEETYQLKVDGEVLEEAEIYRSQRFPSFLIMTPSLSTPFLVIPRSQQVQSVNLMKVSKQANGSIDLLSGAMLANLGRFRVAGTSLAFEVDGRSVVLEEKPPLLGTQPLDAMFGYSTTYRQRAEAYSPEVATIDALKNKSDVKVVVYFGTWCPFCGRYVPRMMKVADQVGAGGVEFEFYGLPKGISSDARARKANVNAVPTGIVFKGGKEVGRIESDAWNAPEKSLVRLAQ